MKDKKQNDDSESTFGIINIALIIIVVGVMAFNALTVAQMTGHAKDFSKTFNFFKGGSKTAVFSPGKTGDKVQDAINAVISKGVPEVYGEELGVTFDDPVKSLGILAKLDNKINVNSLSAADKALFINVTTRISCEYCCGALAVTNQDGSLACGCSHALAPRGLTKYLITKHPGEFTADQLLMEDTKWKNLFFPKQTIQKAVAALDNGLDLTPAVLNDRNLLTKIKSNDLGDIGNLPNMVGGC